MNGSVSYEGSTLLSGAINVNAGGNIEALNVQVTENGSRTIEAPAGVDGYNPITIETNVPEPVLDSIVITQNGTYTPPTGTDGYDEINVNVPQEQPNIQSLTRTISSNGVTTLHASDANCDGFDPVTIRTEVPEPVLISKTITENGTYTPGVGTDGYNEIIVNVAALNYYAKDLILVNHTGQYQGWITIPNALTVGNRYLAIAYREADTIPVSCGVFTMSIGNNIEFSRDKFIRFNSTTEIASPVAYSAGYSISIAEVPADWWNNPFAV